MKTVRETFCAGQPLDFTPFIDVHAHFGPWQETFNPSGLDPCRFIDQMDRMGCDAIWVSSSDPGHADGMRAQNDRVWSFAERFPRRVIPYCTLSSHEPDQCAAELKRCLERGPCIGVKMHTHGQPAYTLQSAFMQPVFEMLAEHRLVYMNHSLGDVNILKSVAASYRDVTFVSGHPDGRANDLAAELSNTRYCTCAAESPDELGREFRRIGRSDSMLLGSDFGIFYLSYGLGMLAYTDLPEADLKNIIGWNALRILSRTKWFEPRDFGNLAAKLER